MGVPLALCLERKHSMNIYSPYTYYIFHPLTNQHYYGVRYAKNCHPDDLWKTYFTSSKKVKQLIKQYGKDGFTVQVRRVFNNLEEALSWEERVLRRLKVLDRDNWLNESIGGKHFRNIKRSEIARKKHSEKTKGRPLTEEHKKAISEASKGKKMPPRTPEQIQMYRDLAAKRKGIKRVFTEEHKQNISIAAKSRKFISQN
jgi:hypothetical protein